MTESRQSAGAFTPGPWHALDIGEVVASSDSDGLPGDRVVCTVAGSEIEPENEANANLIAAAPELYVALETAAKRFRDYEQIHRLKGTEEGYLKADNNGDLAIMCESALAKARGSHD